MFFTYYFQVDNFWTLFSHAFNSHIPRKHRSHIHAYRVTFIFITYIFVPVGVTVKRNISSFTDCTFNFDLVKSTFVGISYHTVIFWMPLASASSSSSSILHPTCSQVRFTIFVEMCEMQWKLRSEEKVQYRNKLIRVRVSQLILPTYITCSFYLFTQ